VPLVSAGDLDVFVACYDVGGALRWAQSAGGPAADFGGGIAAGSRPDEVYVCGGFTGAAVFGTNMLTSVGPQDLFVSRIGRPFDGSGLRWDPPGLSPDGRELRLRVRGLSGAPSVVMLGSTNLVFWEPMLSNAVPSSEWEFTLPVPPAASQRFFRAAVPDE
jgi:hypothetical protein